MRNGFRERRMKMAIESINSVMTAQAIQPANSSAKTAVEYTDVSIAESTPKVDTTTRVVENTEGKSNDSYSEHEPSREQLQRAVEDLNKKMGNAEAIYGFHEATNRVTIKIVDKDTKDVIREVPAEKTLDMIAKVWEIAGLLVDEKR